MDYDFQESIDASVTRYTATLTNARIDVPGEPPKSTLQITEGVLNHVLGTWTLAPHEFWTADPDANVIPAGSFDVHARSYTHDVWTGAYSPGSPLTTHAPRTFTF